MTDIRIKTKYPTQHLAFRSALWSSMLQYLISYDVRFVPQELKGYPDDESVVMTWWQPRCSCGLSYRSIRGPKKKLVWGVNKNDPEKPVCRACRKIWPFAKLVMKPKEMIEKFEWDTDIHSNSKKMSAKLTKAIFDTKTYFSDMFKAHMDLKQSIGP